MSLYEKISKDALAARKSGNRLKATLLTTVISEATRFAKDELREVQDNDIARAIKYFVKNLNKSLEIKETEKEKNELEILHEYVVENKLPTMQEAVAVVLKNNSGSPINKLVGLVMKEVKGTANPTKVKEYIEEIVRVSDEDHL
jgi:Asp-tRNA(Asn)/Glu-tRNA(Gln) amidotransferase B subunit